MKNNSLKNLDLPNRIEDDVPAPTQHNSTIGMLSAEREAKEIEIQMVAAKRFPRDLNQVEENVQQLCKSKKFASQSKYAFSRGGTDITGASVRLVEAVAQLYGNIEHSTNEISRHDDYSECEAYAWDMENNVKVKRSFRVAHYRDTKRGKVRLTDERDIREMIFNIGARLERACMERVIPKYIIDEALEFCDKTLSKSIEGDKFADAVKSVMEYFAELDCSEHDVEIMVGVTKDRWNKAIYNKAVGYYNALADNQTTKIALMDAAPKITRDQIAELKALGCANAESIYAADFQAAKEKFTKIKEAAEDKVKSAPKKTLKVDEDGVVEAEGEFTEDDFIQGLNEQ